ncbi:ThuA domain-containing protein [Pedobacter cryotolerans]|uniref:ThuA domain-containing protein n=1 Tax=Pedobacter cryotolerans TaxID=2571270 RepID=A0A4U1BYD7_9SPHI|nr:ThuA domain-containing protein [Pedobacter cryotolerans]TKB98159.1 ThuA domain-containing protein [Pedobacter cryotolerans]
MKRGLMLVVMLFVVNNALAKMVNALPKDKPSVLVFSLTKGFHHSSIADGIVALFKLGQENNFKVDTTTNVLSFNTQNLKQYKVIIFLNPTGTSVFNDDQKAAFKFFINEGGGFVGIHAATDFSYEWDWYGKLIGGYFESHPKIQEAKLNIVMPKHTLVKGLPSPWLHNDEWYNFKNLNTDVKVLIQADETSYKGGKMKNNHPVSWYHIYDGGKVFYTALGHTNECYSDPVFLKHLLAGIKWAIK